MLIIIAEQQIEEAENSRAANHGPDGKNCLEVNEVDVYKVGEKYYFIAGAKDVFILNEEDKYSSKLSENDIEDPCPNSADEVHRPFCKISLLDDSGDEALLHRCPEARQRIPQQCIYRVLLRKAGSIAMEAQGDCVRPGRLPQVGMASDKIARSNCPP